MSKPLDIDERRISQLTNFLSYLLSNCRIVNGEVIETRVLVKVVNGCRIEIYPRDHNPPHFHVSYNGKSACYDIKDCSLIKGSLGTRGNKIVKYFYEIRNDDLLEIWENTRAGEINE